MPVLGVLGYRNTRTHKQGCFSISDRLSTTPSRHQPPPNNPLWKNGIVGEYQTRSLASHMVCQLRQVNVLFFSSRPHVRSPIIMMHHTQNFLQNRKWVSPIERCCYSIRARVRRPCSDGACVCVCVGTSEANAGRETREARCEA